MPTVFTRRMMLGALPTFGLAGAGVAYAQQTGSRIDRPADIDIAAYLEAWIDTYGRVALTGKPLFVERRR